MRSNGRKVFSVRKTKFNLSQRKCNFYNWIYSCFLLIAQIADLSLWNQAIDLPSDTWWWKWVSSKHFWKQQKKVGEVRDLFQNKAFSGFLNYVRIHSFIKKRFLSGVQKVYSRRCACAAGRMCPLHPHTASVTLVITFYKTLTLSLRFAACFSIHSYLETLMQNKVNMSTCWFVWALPDAQRIRC